ncbi:MAG: SDR family NAD(P)-dependent oxidoreductase [Actinomycetales bacterium]|nr:SDR family NAD(P)-dependent oxidoreductase [Actinomycetales bacterium]
MLTVVVGVGPGMGMSLARRFGAAGEVALLLRDEERGRSFVAELAARGVTARAYAADIADETALRAALARVRQHQGDPDVVVFNASAGPPGSPADVSTTDLELAFRVGTLAAVVAFQEVLPAMRARDSGTFLVTGSGVALDPWPGGTALTLAKTAVRAFVLAAAKDLSGTGVHVATVTVAGVLGTPGFGPDAVAERFWELHEQPRGSWDAEVVHRG